ncbi:hypothetical protein WJX77_011471 [Trebouxia sp. C0004]
MDHQTDPKKSQQPAPAARSLLDVDAEKNSRSPALHQRETSTRTSSTASAVAVVSQEDSTQSIAFSRDAIALGPASESGSLKQLKNRSAQKRFRERQKARSETMETLLLLTTAQLKQTQSKQAPLEARIQLLEALVAASKVSSNTAAPAGLTGALDICKTHGFHYEPHPLLTLSTATPSMQVTLEGRPPTLTLSQIGSMPLTDIAKLYSEYVDELRACLLKLNRQNDPDTIQRLNRLSAELGSLMVCVAFSNPDTFRCMQSSRLDGDVQQMTLPDNLYSALLVPLKFSANQIDDLLWIRRLFHCKLGQLARERRAVVHQMTQSQMDLVHPSEKLSGLTDWAERLKQNGMEEYRTFLQFAVALLQGVYTAKQVAIGAVYVYPSAHKALKMLERRCYIARLDE